ncbi:MAG: SUMF1/EgtB/PvdO family nonheme iron enzyme [Sedimenticola sp.]
MTKIPTNRIDQLKDALDAGKIDQTTFAIAAAAISTPRQDNLSIGTQGAAINGDNSGAINTGRQLTTTGAERVVYAEQGATIVIGDAPVAMTAVECGSVLGRYLQHLISQNRYLQLQGIRSGGKLVNIELDRIYITLRTTRQRTHQDEESDWLKREQLLAPGEAHRENGDTPRTDTTNITVNEALTDHKRLVVLGDPGSGKTTLLRYLALLYARDLAEKVQQVQEKLGLADSGVLPIPLALRQIGRYLKEHHLNDDGTDGHAILLQFLVQSLKNERIEITADFFDDWLTKGHAIVVLDGLDEVADPLLRRRVSRLVDAFCRAYPDCRYVVTSRIVGYTDASQLTEGFATTRVCDFTMGDVRAFLSQWHRLVAVGQMGAGETANVAAAKQTEQLLDSIEKSDRVRELAINPLMLTVIALIHRDRVKLPDRRAELYHEAVEVLLGKWDEARGVQESFVIDDRQFDISDRRLVLQHLALVMHEQDLKEIDAEPLSKILARQLSDSVTDPKALDAAVERFLNVIQERTGLLIARAEGAYAFSHLTFQEYLAALCIAGRDDYVEYTLTHTAEEWWREVILLEAGYLSTQSKERTTRLIRSIADSKGEPAPYHNLVLAAECVRDAGANRIVGDLESELRNRLQCELQTPVARGRLATIQTFFKRGISAGAATERRIAAAEALGQIGGSQYWCLPHGEPEWVSIPGGKFVMGEGSEEHSVYLPDYAISRVPVTNAQYQLFVEAAEHEPPEHWNGKRTPRGKEAHPVSHIGFHDAVAYCHWLSRVADRLITLPSEAEWEKAARGSDDTRQYPWGDAFDATRCNTGESGFGGTTPTGIFLNGASPYGCLDMSGNVWEWTRSLWGTGWEKPKFVYPYDPENAKRENLDAGDEVLRVVRGGSWYHLRGYARCAARVRNRPDLRHYYLGFRVVLRSPPVE